MKKTMDIAIIILFLLSIIIAGCLNEQKSGFVQRRGDFPAGWGRFPGDISNLTEEQRQQMFEERQQISIEACKDKSEGESCMLESPRAEMEGVCEMGEENLVCTFSQQMRPRIE